MFTSVVKVKKKKDCKIVIQCDLIFEDVGKIHSKIMTVVIFWL